MKRGELRWSDRDGGWEMLIPSNAFKNANSSFFGQKPFRLVLPDLLDLYRHLNAYVDRHRGVLLGGAPDTGTLFVKTVETTSKDAAYDQTTFYEAWRLAIQRYGIYNPYTGRGAIAGLLPHGPHNARDVLATHILNHEQASYAIQDTPDMVRLAADLLIERLGGERFSWGGGTLANIGELRARYVAALRAADNHDIAPLRDFART